MNDQYQALYQTFRWLVPAQFNIAQSCCHQWAATPAHARSIAIFYEDEDSQREVWTYGRLAEAVNQLANGLVKLGVTPGDRVAVALGQRPETVVAYMAIYTVGAVSLPLSAQLGPDAMQTRLRDSGTQVAIIDPSSSAALLAAAAAPRASLPWGPFERNLKNAMNVDSLTVECSVREKRAEGPGPEGSVRRRAGGVWPAVAGCHARAHRRP